MTSDLINTYVGLSESTGGLAYPIVCGPKQYRTAVVGRQFAEQETAFVSKYISQISISGKM